MNMFNLFRLCRKDEISFDIVVVKNGNNVEAIFDIAERIVHTCSIRQCCLDIVAGADAALVVVANVVDLRHLRYIL